jgi:hypothetical protein
MVGVHPRVELSQACQRRVGCNQPEILPMHNKIQDRDESEDAKTLTTWVVTVHSICLVAAIEIEDDGALAIRK